MSDFIDMTSINDPDQRKVSDANFPSSGNDTASTSKSKVVPNISNLFKFRSEIQTRQEASGPKREKSESVLISWEESLKEEDKAKNEADSFSNRFCPYGKKTWMEILTEKPGINSQFWGELRKHSTEGCQVLKCDKKRYYEYISSYQERWGKAVCEYQFYGKSRGRGVVLTKAKLLRWFEAQLKNPSKLADSGGLSEQTVNRLYEQFPKEDSSSPSTMVYKELADTRDCSRFLLLDDHVQQKILTIETVCDKACKDPTTRAQAEQIQKECNNYKESVKREETNLIRPLGSIGSKGMAEWVKRGQRLLALEKLIEADKNILADPSWSKSVDREAADRYGPLDS